MQLTLRQYLRMRGDDDKVARECGVGERTVSSWRRGERFPSSASFERLLTFSDGWLSYELSSKEWTGAKPGDDDG